MAGRPPQVGHVKHDFLKELTSARNLTSAILALPVKVRPGNAIGVHPKHTRQIIELAFMGVVAAWEEFLEQSLVRYVAGSKFSNGQGPTHKYGRADTIIHAYELLSQDARYDPQKDYLKVNDPRWVWRTADFFFSSHPYAALSSQADLIRHASAIRNRVAHGSEKCRTDFKATTIYFLQPQNGLLTQGYGPGDLLQAPVLRHFRQRLIQQRASHFEAYLDMYENLANYIVP